MGGAQARVPQLGQRVTGHRLQGVLPTRKVVRRKNEPVRCFDGRFGGLRKADGGWRGKLEPTQQLIPGAQPVFGP